MPPPKAPVVIETAQTEAHSSIVAIEGTLASLLESCGVTDPDKVRDVASGDLKSLTEQQRLAVAEWHAKACGLHASEVAVCSMQGRVIPYVKASGVMRFSRDRFKSIDHEEPKIISHGQKSFVVVFATVVMNDGRSVREFAARSLADHNSLMACSTAATVRALRIAVGIPLPSEGEL